MTDQVRHTGGTGGPPAKHAGRLIVTIDGPAGVGKSSVGRALAKSLGLEFLDTGAMYRAATALALDRGVDVSDASAVAALAREARLHFDWTQDPPALIAFDQPVMGRLRDADVDANVSTVAGLPELRAVMVDLQQSIGQRHPRLVSEGRDQGSVVFPDACVKIYLDATPRSRAERRARQISGVDIDAVEADLIERDRRDSERAVAPLRQPPDAEPVETSAMSFDQVVATLAALVRAKVGDALPGEALARRRAGVPCGNAV
ncbi:MAG: (d)CMP kinase [Phycisphaerales bacterium]|nr:(d)CMP kinase [Phycisphaerales bacterium]